MNKAKWMKVTALVPATAAAVVLLVFAFGETLGGDWSGLGHLIQAVPLLLLLWLGWRRPFWGGLLLLVVVVLALHFFGNVLRGPDSLAPFLILIAPLLLSGLLFLGVAWVEQREA